MLSGMLALSHEQQQQAAERIQALMAEGLSSGQAIAQVAQELRQTHQGERINLIFDDEEQE